MGRAHQTPAYRKWRAQVLKQCPPVCIRCGAPVDMTLPGTHPDGPTADHEPPIAITGEIAPPLEGSGIAHSRCNKSHGGRLGSRIQQQRTSSTFSMNAKTLPPPPMPNITKEGRGSAVQPLMGADGVLTPRLETRPSRAVTGSYGGRASAWLRDVYGMELRGWQRYALERLLEHDAAGDLVWSTAVITVARQSGKSYLTRALCMWRMHEGRELWGEEQTVMHVANKRETAMEVMRPAGLWAMDRYGKKAARWGAARAGIDLPTGDRWIIHAANESAGVGFSVGMVFVDEAWQVARGVVDDALAPTMLERRSPQLVLVSTAGDSTSDLLLSYRQRAIDRLDNEDPGSVLLLEWSAPPDADPDLVDTWKWASPEWTDRREVFLRGQWQNIEPAAFATQYLNQWVARVDSWLTDAMWDQTCDPDRELPADQVWHVAVESDFDGLGHAVAVAAQDADGRIVTRVTTHRTVVEVDQRIDELRRGHPALEVWATPSYRDRLKAMFQMVGQREAAAATQALLDAIDRRVLAHDGSQVLREHFHAATVSKRQAGWVLTAPMGKAGVYAARAVMFAVWQAGKIQKPAPAIHFARRAT